MPNNSESDTMPEVPFSQRHGLSGPPPGTLIHEDAPRSARITLAELLPKLRGLEGVEVRNLICKAMDVEPDPKFWNDYIAWPEVKRLIYECEWFHFYEILEDVSQLLQKKDGVGTGLVRMPRQDVLLADAMNEEFSKRRIGWQLVNGKVVTRGDEAFESTVKTAVNVLEQDNKPTAAGHVRFAIDALSARPTPNTGGAVSHAINAVECVLGKITGKTMPLGKYLDKNPHLFHPALKKGLDGIYGYASDEGARHGKEGTEPAREEAEFTVAVCAAVCTLLTRKHAGGQQR